MGIFLINIFNFCDCCHAICTFKNSTNSPCKWAVAVAFLYFVALLSHKITPPAIHGLSSGGRTGRRNWVCWGWGLRICTKAPKDVTVLLQGQDALFFLRISGLEIIFHCLKLQELVINPITAVDFAAVNVSRNKKNCRWGLVFCVERNLYYCGISYVRIGSVASQGFET